MHYLTVNNALTAILTYLAILPISGNPVHSIFLSQTDDQLHRSNDNPLQNIKNASVCTTKLYEPKYVTLFDNGSLLLKTEHVTVLTDNYQSKDGKVLVCYPVWYKRILSCDAKFMYESHEYHIYPNESALVGDVLVPETSYDLEGDILLICAESQVARPEKDRLGVTPIYVSQIGSGISIVALLIHLLTFLYLPSLRNLHGYNLASLSIAFLLGYSCILIGQIPQVLGLSCVISAILQQNFFLAAFFCMNVLAYDIWRRLKRATEQLYFERQQSCLKKFVWYTLYAWGAPLVITSVSVIVDNTEGVPDEVKPDYGKNDTCWIGHNLSQAIFFTIPALTLIVVNTVFFVLTAWILFTNKMDCTKDQRKHAAKNNFVLYVKLALMMGLTWLVGIVALASQNDILWLIFDILNSLQGLFLLLLFTCTRKVATKLVEKTRVLKVTSTKKTAFWHTAFTTVS